MWLAADELGGQVDAAVLPDGAETFELRPFISPDDDAWMALVVEDGTKSRACALDAVARRRDRRHPPPRDGHIIRSPMLVRKYSLIGLGKEGSKLGGRIKIG